MKTSVVLGLGLLLLALASLTEAGCDQNGCCYCNSQTGRIINQGRYSTDCDPGFFCDCKYKERTRKFFGQCDDGTSSAAVPQFIDYWLSMNEGIKTKWTLDKKYLFLPLPQFAPFWNTCCCYFEFFLPKINFQMKKETWSFIFISISIMYRILCSSLFRKSWQGYLRSPSPSSSWTPSPSSSTPSSSLSPSSQFLSQVLLLLAGLLLCLHLSEGFSYR